ncbi:MAG TPA: hypothetical protein VMH30_05635, partial [Verrucomicrobiae bacterium]|nr:hypothetical protein [Verrucomicrobiae bacterium]
MNSSSDSIYDDGVPATYDELLGATIQRLEDLKSRGIRHVPVSSETLRQLALPPKPAQIPVARPQAEKPGPSIPAPIAEQRALLPLPGEAAPDSKPALDPAEKAAAFAALRERAMVCVKCKHLASSRKNVVFGVGNIDAELMFVGEAPGADEDTQGEP